MEKDMINEARENDSTSPARPKPRAQCSYWTPGTAQQPIDGQYRSEPSAMVERPEGRKSEVVKNVNRWG